MAYWALLQHCGWELALPLAASDHGAPSPVGNVIIDDGEIARTVFAICNLQSRDCLPQGIGPTTLATA
jgi:hypothetical protein